ncbi:hypothetical protein BKA56DRAFT_620873 [Ilyonectria sp. MPI-CAGE-AT-0026]|nr:hypothetical protein BKA56DRAFT_620873 [Ilyonectria sp. MPI-CAGE-AT-0026]
MCPTTPSHHPLTEAEREEFYYLSWRLRTKGNDGLRDEDARRLVDLWSRVDPAPISSRPASAASFATRTDLTIESDLRVTPSIRQRVQSRWESGRDRNSHGAFQKTQTFRDFEAQVVAAGDQGMASPSASRSARRSMPPSMPGRYSSGKGLPSSEQHSAGIYERSIPSPSPPISFDVRRWRSDNSAPTADMSAPKHPHRDPYIDDDDDDEASSAESEDTVNPIDTTAAQLSRLQSQHDEALQGWNRSITKAAAFEAEAMRLRIRIALLRGEQKDSGQGRGKHLDTGVESAAVGADKKTRRGHRRNKNMPAYASGHISSR